MKKRKSKRITNITFSGVSLFEYTLYLVIFSIVISVCFYGVVKVYKPFVQKSTFCAVLSSAYSACDVLARDVRAASANEHDWYKTDPHEIIFKSAKEDIGWSYQKKRLLRTIGSYNASTQVWNNKTRRVATAPVHEVSFVVQTQSGRVVTVSVCCQLKNACDTHIITQELALRNRDSA